MKRVLLFVAILFQSAMLLAQDVDIDKETGMVKVDGKDAFYLAPKNKTFMECDYSLQNLEHKELAYLKHTTAGKSTNYFMVFTKSGNQCTLTGFGTLVGVKHLAKMIAGASLVQNNAVSEEEERKFITLHYGTFVKDPASTPPPPTERVVVVNNDTKRNIPPADISIKETNIYNNSEMVGVFKRSTDGVTTTISVYNANDAMVCKATHPDNNDAADWSLLLDGKPVTLLYNPTTPLEKLFKYLAEKGFL